MENLNWQFSHSLFSSGQNPPGYLELNGRYVPEVHRAFQRKSEFQTVLTEDFEYYEDIFAYTISPVFTSGNSFYHHQTPDDTVSYDAPKYDPNINQDGDKDPLTGLHDLLTNKYGAIRTGSRVEVFVLAYEFPDYAPEVIADFLNAHKNLRVHALYRSSQNKIGGLVDIVEKTGGSINKLCSGNKNIGPELAEIVKQKPVSEPRRRCRKK